MERLRGARATWYAVNAASAWLGLAVSVAINLSGAYRKPILDSSRYGYNKGAVAPLAEGFFDWVSFFTIWSSVVVGIALAALWLRTRQSPPAAASSPTTEADWPAPLPRWLADLWLSGLVMVTVTGLVFNLVLSSQATQEGWDNLANSLLHQVTPVLSVVVFGVIGPRGQLRWSTVGRAIIIPLAWVLWMLGRGAMTGTYPYGFIDIVDLGTATAMVNLAGVLALGLAVAAGFVGLDKLLSRTNYRTNSRADSQIDSRTDSRPDSPTR